MNMKIRMCLVPLYRWPFDREWAAELRKETIRSLSRLNFLELIYPSEEDVKDGLISSDYDALPVIQKFKQKGVDAILLGALTYPHETAAADIVHAFKGVPVGLFATKEPPLPPDGLRKSDSFCGTLALAATLHKRELPFVFLGIHDPRDESFLRKVESFGRASAIIKGLSGARIGMIGPRPETFEMVSFNEHALIKRFNLRIIPISLYETVKRMEKISNSDDRVLLTIKDMGETADLSDVPKDDLMAMAKLEIALRELSKEKSLTGIAIKGWLELQEYIGITPYFVMSRLTQDGIICAMESDVLGLLSMLMQYFAALKTTPPLLTDWTLQHPTKPNVFLAWHAGFPITLRHKDSSVKIEYPSTFYKAFNKKYYGTPWFRLKPGQVTLSRMVEYNGEFKMFIAKGTVLDEGGPFKDSWGWVKVSNLERIYRMLIEEGFTQHVSMIYGDYVEPISIACKFLGIKTIVQE